MSRPQVSRGVVAALSVLDHVVSLLSTGMVAEVADAVVRGDDIGYDLLPPQAARVPLLTVIARCLVSYALVSTRQL